MKTPTLEEYIKLIVSNALDEYNAMATGAVVGYTGPLGTPTGPIHKGFWRKDLKKKVKTASPALHKGKGLKEEVEIDWNITRPDPNNSQLHGSSDYFEEGFKDQDGPMFKDLGKSSPKLKMEADGQYIDIKDPVEFIKRVLLGHTKTAALTIYRPGDKNDDENVYEEDTYVGGVDVELVAKVRDQKALSHAWFWPSKTLDVHKWDHTEPRFDNLDDAIIQSVKMNNGLACYIIARARGDFSGLETLGFKLRADFFDNEDYIPVGTVEKWWMTWFAQALVGKPTLWKGSDDPMTENVLDDMGHKKITTIRGKDVYLQKDADSLSNRTIIKKIAKNLNKDSMEIHNPPEMGISIARPSLKDRKVK
jgi:hypothetical protein